MLVLCSYVAFAQPEAPTIIDSSSSRRTPTGVASIEAIAGNVTSLSIHGFTSTRTWQGFYGNISGSLVLSNGDNDLMYDWNITAARGQLYATTNDTINWNAENIACYDFNNALFDEYYTLPEFEADLNIPEDAVDGINETFSLSEYPTFYVGYKEIATGDGCHSTYLYEDGVQGTNFIETMLYENQSESIIFTSLLNGSNIGFDGDYMDFQMIVPADGREGNTESTTYYLYIELI